MVKPVGTRASKPIRIGGAPFDDREADVVLRTSDSIDFYVYKVVLELASPFFKQMFSLKQDPTSIIDDRPVIDVSEPSKTIDHLLRLCYPVKDPPTDDLGHTVDVLKAAMKYDMDEASFLMETALRSLAQRHPVRVYVVACELGLEDVARVAAMEWEKSKMTPGGPSMGRRKRSGWKEILPCAKCTSPHSAHTDDGPLCNSVEFPNTNAYKAYAWGMGSITAGAYYRLLEYNRTKSLPTSFCAASRPISTLTIQTSPEPTVPNYGIPGESTADIILRSSDGAQIKVHRVVLELASAEGIYKQVVEYSQAEGLPIAKVEEGAGVLARFLEMCYPFGNNSTSGLTPGETLKVLDAAKKYGAARLVDQARKDWSIHLKSSPLSGYFIAAANNWESEAKEAAKLLLGKPIEGQYVSEMESAPASTYFGLLKYLHECNREIQKFTRDQSSSGAEWSDIKEEDFTLEGGETTLFMIAAPLVNSKYSLALNRDSQQELARQSKELNALFVETLSKVPLQLEL